MTIAEESMNRQKLNRRYTEMLQIIDRRIFRKAGKSSAFGIRQKRTEPGSPAQVGFVNNAFAKTVSRRNIAFPVVRAVIDDDRFGNIRRGIQRRKRQILFRTVNVVSEYCLIPDQGTDQFFTIRINQEFVRVKPHSLCRFIWTVDPVSVDHSRFGAGQINMPNAIAVFINAVTFQFFGTAFIKYA